MTDKTRFIHLLYAPTNFCNMACKYCYLGTATDENSDTVKALSTLEYTVEKFLSDGIIPFNLSLHGGEATAIPKRILKKLLEYIYTYYQRHGNAIKDAGFPLNPVHIKTNLYNFDQLSSLFEEYGVSVSASIDLPLSLHERYRVDKRGRSTLKKIIENLNILSNYPHHKKISCVITQEHLSNIEEFISDVKYIHYDIGIDMTNFNIMFSFDSKKNIEKFGEKNYCTEMLTQKQQVYFYQKIVDEFSGSELDSGVKNHWFKEFTPDFCCSAVNCGNKFFMLQSSGDIYACPRGQSSDDFYYGSIYENNASEILEKGWKVIESLQNSLESENECFSCNYLPYCNQGCVFVRDQVNLGKSYTCLLQKEIYKSNIEKYPPYSDDYVQRYATQYKFHNSIQSIKPIDVEPSKPYYLTPELTKSENSLSALISKDTILQKIYNDKLFTLEIDTTCYPLRSPILNNINELALITSSSEVNLIVNRSVFNYNCKDPVNNYLHIILLRNTLVTYGDENREKQEHLIDYSIYQKTFNQLSSSDGEYEKFDLTPFFEQHKSLFINGVRNNIFITTKELRDYHYLKQKKNAFYHIQAINLPFPFLEFYWTK